RFVGQLVKLRDNAGQLLLNIREGIRDHRQLRRVLAPVDLCLRRGGEEVKSDIELSGQQAPTSELPTQPPLLNQLLNEGVALLYTLRDCFPNSFLLLLQPRNEPLGEEHNLHPPANIQCRRIEVETDIRHFACGQTKKGNRRTRGQPPQRFVEMQHIVDREGGW